MARAKTAEGIKKQDDAILPHCWQRGQSGNPNGRPRKFIKTLEEKIGVEFGVALSREDKFAILESMLEMSITELKLIESDLHVPSFMTIIATALVKDYKNGSLYTITELFDRFFGKARQTQEITGAGGEPLVPTVDYSALTPEERLQLLSLVKKSQQ